MVGTRKEEGGGEPRSDTLSHSVRGESQTPGEEAIDDTRTHSNEHHHQSSDGNPNVPPSPEPPGTPQGASKDGTQNLDLEAATRAAFQQTGAANATPRLIRRQVEKALGKEEGELDDKKGDIKNILQRLIDEEDEDPEDEDADASNDDEVEADDDDGEGTKRKRKKPATPSAPRGLKKLQSGVMTRSVFDETAKAFQCQIGPHHLGLNPKAFSTGGRGWFVNGKLAMPISDDVTLTAQLTLNLSVIGSKEWKD